MSLEVAFGGHVVMRSKIGRVVLAAEHGVNFGQRPDVEFALLALGIGVERCAEGALPGRHLARQPCDGLVCPGAKELVVRALVRDPQQLEQECVVVEHLLEMRDQPAVVDRIAREAAAEVIVDTALAHPGERQLHRAVVALVVHALAGAPKELEHHGLRKFGRAAHAAVDGVDHAGDLIGGAVEFRGGDDDAPCGPRAFRQAGHERAAVLLDALRFVTKDALDLAQEVDEGGFAVARGFGKIGAAPERLAIRSEEHGERPAAVLAEMVQRRHVDLVDVGAFFAVHFDVDEEFVHHVGGCRVFEALVRHDVAPVAGGVSHGQQDGLIGALGFGKRLGAPRPPVDGIVLVLQQVRTGLAREPVFVGSVRG